MFRDQYDFLPGALGVENCKKYPEFSMQKGDEPTQYPSQCDDPTSQKTLLSESTAYTTYKQANFSMVDMVVSGMVENRSPGERRRKKFDIAEKQETTCIEVPAIRGGKCKIKSSDHIGDIDMPSYHNDYYVGFHRASDGQNIRIELCDKGSRHYSSNATEDVFDSTKTGITCSTPYSSATSIFNTTCSDKGVIQGNLTANTFGSGCRVSETYNKTYKFIYIGPMGSTYINLSPYGLQRHKDKTEKECETKTIPGEPRMGYLLKKDEIENQANKSSFDSKTWISYTGGKVDNLMIYGIGNNNVLSGAEDNSAIVFFHFDPDKTELTDDGAVSYALYDLIVKKLGEQKDGGIGNIVPVSKTGGQGFNFGYIMR